MPKTADQTVVFPAASDPNPSDLAAVVYIYSSNVTVDGFTIDGSNNVADGVQSYSAVGNIAIQNNIVENTTYTGIHFDNYYDANGNPTQAATAGSTISENLLQNLGGGGFGYGIGVYLCDNFYADVQDNVMSDVRVGVQTGNFYLANPFTTASISNNVISATAVGIYYNLYDSPATPFTVVVNTITAVADPSITQWDGILISSQQGNVSASFENNTLDGSSSTAGVTFGYYVWSTPTTGSLLISGGSVQGVGYGVCVSNYGDADATQAAISGVKITASLIGVDVADSADQHHSSRRLGEHREQHHDHDRGRPGSWSAALTPAPRSPAATSTATPPASSSPPAAAVRSPATTSAATNILPRRPLITAPTCGWTVRPARSRRLPTIASPERSTSITSPRSLSTRPRIPSTRRPRCTGRGQCADGLRRVRHRGQDHRRD